MKISKKKSKGKKIESNLPEKTIRPRLLKGVVIRDVKDKTVSVLVNRYKLHSKYRKRYKISKKYLAHDEENKCRKGDQVTIKEVRPMSKRKKWEIVNKA